MYTVSYTHLDGGVRKLERRRNEEIRRDLRLNSVIEALEGKKLLWFGHLVKREKNVKLEMDGIEMVEKNRRGSLRQTWNTSVKIM